MAVTEEILGQFLGDETFPVEWASEAERDFFWVYDDLHIPHPVSPMFFDIGGWWLSLRPHVPALRDALRGRLAGQERQRLRLHDGHPGRPGPAHRGHRVQLALRRPRPARRATTPRRWAPISTSSCRSTASTSPTGGTTGWCPRCSATSTYLEERLDAADEMSLAETATLLEDAIDVHDRHWKIHWMLNFAQLSATLDLRAVMERVRGTVDEALLGRLQNSASDRNWDSIEALWGMKNEVRDDPELRAAFEPEAVEDIAASLQATERRPALHRRADRAVPARVRLACRLEPRVHLPDGPRADGAGPRARPRLPRHRLRLPDGDRRDASRHRGRVRGDPGRAEGRGARGDARRQRDQPADGAAHAGPPLLHRPGRQRASPARAAGGRTQARRGGPAGRRPTTCCSCATTSCERSSAAPGARRPGDRRRAPRRARGAPTGSSRATGSAR